MADDLAFDSAPRLELGGVAEALKSLGSSATHVNVETVRTSFAECKLCAAAYAAAIKTHTSNVKDPSR